MKNVGDAQYTIQLTLGQQAITGVLDTSSCDLVVFGAACEGCNGSAQYNSTRSQTYAEGWLMTEYAYGWRRLTSAVARDRLALGPVEVENQTFWNVKHARGLDVSGAILGVGPPEAFMVAAWETADSAVLNVTTYYDLGLQAPEAAAAEAKAKVNLANEVSKSLPPLSTLNITTFSVCMGDQPRSDGLLVWNDTAVLEHPDAFHRITVVGKHTWSVNVSDARLVRDAGAWSSKLGCVAGCSALMDSSAPVLGVPSFIVQGLQTAMGQLDEECGNLGVLPDISLRLGDVVVSLPPSSYVARVQGSGAWPAPRLPMLADKQPRRPCRLMLAETRAFTKAGPLWILGMPFFRSYYTTFKVGNTIEERSVFIAPQKRCAPLSPSGRNPSRSPQQPLRSVDADKIRFSQTLHTAMMESFVHL